MGCCAFLRSWVVVCIPELTRGALVSYVDQDPSTGRRSQGLTSLVELGFGCRAGDVDLSLESAPFSAWPSDSSPAGWFEAAEEAQEPVENCERMGRISRNIQIDGQEAVDSVVNLGMAAEDAAGDRGMRRRRSRSWAAARRRRFFEARASCSR